MVGVQLLWLCVILCYIWLSLAGLKPQLIIWFLKRRNMAALHSRCASHECTASLHNSGQEKCPENYLSTRKFAALQSCVAEHDFWKMLPAEGVQPSLPMHRALNWIGCVPWIPSSSPQDLISAQLGAAGPCSSDVAGNRSLLFCHCPVQLWSLQSSLIHWWSSKVLLTSKLMKLIGGVFSRSFPCPWNADLLTFSGQRRSSHSPKLLCKIMSSDGQG